MTNKTKKKQPLKKRIKWWLKRLPYRITHDLKWWFLHRFHPKHRYHMINTGLGYGWRDRDVVMEQLIVKLLIDFVEGEKPFEHWDIEKSRNAAEWKRLKEIYDFFKVNDPHKMDRDDLTPWLIEIVQLREIMWT